MVSAPREGPGTRIGPYKLLQLIGEGGFVCVLGASGAGKSSLLNVLGLMDHDWQGSYRLDGIAVETLNPKQRQHLCNQLSLTPLGARDRQLVGLLIEALDEDGYLSASLEELVELFPAEMEVDLPELGTALKLLQSFDPAGIGARELGECLWLQLNTLPDDLPHLAVAKTMVRDHLGLLAEREYGKLKKLFDLSDTEFIHLRQLITSLNPRPGSDYAPLDMA